MSSTQIKGILFDLGDTLLDFGRVDVLSLFESGARQAYEYLKTHKLPLPPFAKYHRQQLWAIRWSYLKSRLTRREFNALDIIGRLSLRMGHDLTHQQTLELAWLWYEPLGRCAKIEEGVLSMLEEFRVAGLTLGLVSNTFVPGEVIDRHLLREGLLHYLPVRVYSCDVRWRKPNPNIFAAALDQAGLKPGQSLFVGDSLQCDIDGANHTGMISVLKDPSDAHLSSSIQPRHRIHHLVELKDIVARYNGRP